MSKIILLICIFCLIFSGYLQADQDKLFESCIVSPSFKLTDYQAIFVDYVDIKDVNLDLFDPYPVDRFSNNYDTPAEIKGNLARQTRQCFIKALEKIIPVLRNTRDIGEKKTLLLTLKLSGTVQDEGLLDSFILSRMNRKTWVSLDCRIYDLTSKEEFIVISDNYIKLIEIKDVSTLRGSDIDNWYEAMDYWAERLAQFLQQRI